MARTQLEKAASAALDVLQEMGSFPSCPIEAKLHEALEAASERSVERHELWVMAAGLETPDDLTPEEQEQNAQDIIKYLLDQAEVY